MDKEPATLKSELKKLNKRHSQLLAPGEEYQSVLKALSTDKAQPSAFWIFAGALGALLGQMLAMPAARRRGEELAARFGHNDLGSFPKSKNGYTIAASQTRVFVFDGRSKKLLSEGPIGPMRLEALDHGSNMTSVVFTDGAERIAVTSLRSDPTGTKHFIASFPSDQVVMSAPQFATAGVREF